jgi:hypothetical protein
MSVLLRTIEAGLPVAVCLGGNLRDRRIDQCVEALLIDARLTAADDVGTQHLEVIDVVKVILSHDIALALDALRGTPTAR